MESCEACGRPRKAGVKFCTGCGTRFPDLTQQSQPPPQTERPSSSRHWLRAGIAVVLAGVAAGVFLLVNHTPGSPPRRALTGNTRTIAPHRATAPATAPSPSPPPQAQPTAAPAPAGVTVLASAAQNQDATSVAGFLGQYFGAINSRDYQGYISLFTAQGRPLLTQAQFSAGYRSTTDSAETLTGLSTAASGDLAANVTFTSHQDPADSVTGTQSCTHWTVTFFLLQANGGYLIDKPPTGYHAAYAAC